MSFSPSHNDKSLTTHANDIRVLGETGLTVVYLFPDGRALPERETPDFDSLENSAAGASASKHQILDELVAQGKMTAAQKMVVLHDLEATDMSLTDVLAARGWL